MNDILNGIKQKQQEDEQWKDEVLKTLKSIDEKLTIIIENGSKS